MPVFSNVASADLRVACVLRTGAAAGGAGGGAAGHADGHRCVHPDRGGHAASACRVRGAPNTLNNTTRTHTHCTLTDVHTAQARTLHTTATTHPQEGSVAVVDALLDAGTRTSPCHASDIDTSIISPCRGSVMLASITAYIQALTHTLTRAHTHTHTYTHTTHTHTHTLSLCHTHTYTHKRTHRTSIQRIFSRRIPLCSVCCPPHPKRLDGEHHVQVVSKGAWGCLPPSSWSHPFALRLQLVQSMHLSMRMML